MYRGLGDLRKANMGVAICTMQCKWRSRDHGSVIKLLYMLRANRLVEKKSHNRISHSIIDSWNNVTRKIFSHCSISVVIFYWSICTKPGNWTVVYMCVSDIEFAYFNDSASVNSIYLGTIDHYINLKKSQ